MTAFMMTPLITLTGDTLVVQTDRPARVVASFRLPDEGGVFIAEADVSHTYWLPGKVGSALRRWAGAPAAGTFRVVVSYGRAGRVEVRKETLLAAALAPTPAPRPKTRTSSPGARSTP